MIYKTYTERCICPVDSDVNLENVWSVLRGNSLSIDSVFKKISQENEAFYVHYLDGDEWGERECWKLFRKLDQEFALTFFNLIENKDCLCAYADEFILVDKIDRSEDLANLLKDRPYTMTIVVFRCTGFIPSLKDIRLKLLKSNYRQKQIQKGTLTHYDL